MNSFPREHGALAKPTVAGRPRTPKEAILPNARSLARKEDERFKRDVAGDLHGSRLVRFRLLEIEADHGINLGDVIVVK